MGTAIGWLGWKGLRVAKAVASTAAKSAGAAEIGTAEENAEKQPQEV
ncbi:MAG TPA: hypothetical protein VL551_15660 [Actinospica sp.]|jgi:hypothetical protein|nr:hypothetical protein [Actinospica sp.]